MNKSADKLTAIQDQVYSDPRLKPERDPNTGVTITHCNSAAHAVARAYGCLAFLNIETNAPYLADEICKIMATSKDFTLKLPEECTSLVSQGTLIFAALPSDVLHEPHGHVCSLTPGNPEFSGKWNKTVPACMNIGGFTTTFRNRGINWAFPVDKQIPYLYAWIPSL